MRPENDAVGSYLKCLSFCSHNTLPEFTLFILRISCDPISTGCLVYLMMVIRPQRMFFFAETITQSKQTEFMRRAEIFKIISRKKLYRQQEHQRTKDILLHAHHFVYLPFPSPQKKNNPMKIMLQA